jgi:hypothetical protein
LLPGLGRSDSDQEQFSTWGGVPIELNWPVLEPMANTPSFAHSARRDDYVEATEKVECLRLLCCFREAHVLRIQRFDQQVAIRHGARVTLEYRSGTRSER